MTSLVLAVYLLHAEHSTEALLADLLEARVLGHTEQQPVPCCWGQPVCSAGCVFLGTGWTPGFMFFASQQPHGHLHR